MMYDSDEKLLLIGKDFLLKNHRSIENKLLNDADEIVFKYIQQMTKTLRRCDLITAGAITRLLIENGYLKTEFIEGKGLVVLLSSKGKDFVYR